MRWSSQGFVGDKAACSGRRSKTTATWQRWGGAGDVVAAEGGAARGEVPLRRRRGRGRGAPVRLPRQTAMAGRSSKRWQCVAGDEHVGGGARGCATARRLRCEFACAFGLIQTREHHRVVLTQRRRLWGVGSDISDRFGRRTKMAQRRASYSDAQGVRRGKEGGRSSPSGSRWPVVSLVAAELDANGGASVVDGEATSKPKTRGLSGSCCWAIGRGRGLCSY